MRRLPFLASLLVSIALVTGVSAHAATWVIDENHSSVSFKVRHLFTKVPGGFLKFAGTVEYDPAKPEAGSVTVSIDAASVNTRQERRDKHLRSADFFDVESYPMLTFESTKVVKGEGNAFTVEGNLTMRGVTKPVTLAAVYLGSNERTAGFEATTTVNRKDFDISWNRTLDNGGVVLGDDVEITITIEANVPEKTKS